MEKIEKLQPRAFTKFCMTIGAVPSSYLDGMTVERQLLWFCSYLEKEVIPAVNNNAGAVEELQALYTELKSYVDHYFDNLDVQKEINNKLDEMAEDGTLDEIIAQYLQLQGILAYNSVADMKAATNLVDGSFAETYGYYSYGDGGNAKYKVRQVTNQDVEDDVLIIALHDENLVAELILDNSMNIECFGAVGNGTTEDTQAFIKAIESKVRIKGNLDKKYKINTIDVDENLYIENCNFYSDAFESQTDVKMLFKTSDEDVYFKNCSFESTFEYTPVINIVNGSNVGTASNVMCLRLNGGGKVENCKFKNVYAIDTRGTSQIINCYFDNVEMGIFTNAEGGNITVNNCDFIMSRLTADQYYHALYIPTAESFIANNITIQENGVGQCGDHLHFKNIATTDLTVPKAIVSNCTIIGDLSYGYLTQNSNATLTFENLSYKGTTNGSIFMNRSGNTTFENCEINCASTKLFDCYNTIISNNSVFNLLNTTDTVQIGTRCNLDLHDTTINASGDISMATDVNVNIADMFNCTIIANSISSLNYGGNSTPNNIINCLYKLTTGTLNLIARGYLSGVIRHAQGTTALTTVADHNSYSILAYQSNTYFKKVEGGIF